MRLWHGVLARWIARLALFGTDLALAGNAALQSRLDFLTALLLERIGATAGQHRACDHEQERQGPHPLILGMKLSKANRGL